MIDYSIIPGLQSYQILQPVVNTRSAEHRIRFHTRTIAFATLPHITFCGHGSAETGDSEYDDLEFVYLNVLVH